MNTQAHNKANRPGLLGTLSTIGTVAGASWAANANAELVQINFQSYGMLPDGKMRVILGDGRAVVLRPAEFTFLDNSLYLDSSALARINYGGSAVLPRTNAVQRSIASDAEFWSDPWVVGGTTVLSAAGAWGTGSVFGWFEDNSTPVFEAVGQLPASTVQKGTASGAVLVADLTDYFSEADGTITYSISATRDDGSVASSLFAISNGSLYTLENVTADNAGQYIVSIFATDTGDDENATQTITIDFVGEDPFAASGAMPGKTVAENSAAGTVLFSDLTQFFTAADGDITYSLSVTDENGVITETVFGVNNGALFSLQTANSETAGIYTVVLTATDRGDNEIATQSLVITVEGNPDIEPQNVIPSPTVSEETPSGSIVLSTIAPFFKNATGTVSYSITVTNQFGAQVSNVMGLLNDQVITLSDATAAFQGLYTVTLTATDSDGGDTAQQTFSVLFESDDLAPTVDQGIGNQTVQENAAFTFTIPNDAFDDDDGISGLSVEDLPEGLIFDSGSRTITGTPTEGGSSTVTVTATDIGGQEVSTTFTIFVTNINDAPELQTGVSDPYVLNNVGGNSLDNGDPFVLDLNTLVEDEEGDSLTFSTTYTLPPEYILTSGGVLSGTADTTDHTILVKVEDGNGGEFQFDVIVDVTGVNSNNDPSFIGSVSSPYVISTAADQTALNFGDIIYFDLQTIIEDIDGDTLSFTSSNISNYPNSNGGQLDLTNNGIITGLARDTQFSLSVTASDGVGGTLNFIVDLAVI